MDARTTLLASVRRFRRVSSTASPRALDRRRPIRCERLGRVFSAKSRVQGERRSQTPWLPIRQCRPRVDHPAAATHRPWIEFDPGGRRVIYASCPLIVCTSVCPSTSPRAARRCQCRSSSRICRRRRPTDRPTDVACMVGRRAVLRQVGTRNSGLAATQSLSTNGAWRLHSSSHRRHPSVGRSVTRRPWWPVALSLTCESVSHREWIAKRSLSSELQQRSEAPIYTESDLPFTSGRLRGARESSIE